MEHTKNQGQQDPKRQGMANTKNTKPSDDRKTGTSKRGADSASGSDRSSRPNDSR